MYGTCLDGAEKLVEEADRRLSAAASMRTSHTAGRILQYVRDVVRE